MSVEIDETVRLLELRHPLLRLGQEWRERLQLGDEERRELLGAYVEG